MSKIMYNLIKPYRCKVCGQDMLFFENKKQMLIDYKGFLDDDFTLSEMKRNIENRGVRYLRCIQCGRSFIIDWSHGWPEQLMDMNAIRRFGVGVKQQ